VCSSDLHAVRPGTSTAAALLWIALTKGTAEMAIRVGTAPVSWGVWFPEDGRQPAWKQFLDEAALAGYKAIELGPFGYLPTDREILRRELRSRDLALTGAFVFGAFQSPGAWVDVRDEVSRMCELLNEFDAKHLVLINAFHTDLFTGQSIGPPVLGADEWLRMIESVQRVGEFTKGQGITAVFHPHAETPIEYEDQVERFLADTDPTQVSLCLDVGHYAYRNGDPLALMRRHSERIPYLHLKNVDATLLKRANAREITFAQAVEMGVFTDLDKGAVDFVALRSVADDVGFTGWGIVEQDMYPVEFDKPLPIARHNRAYLQQIGFG
jgi:inosose dehydratase